ncbi:MAG TPA: IPT/TIG domain-containing protein, partial [Bacteroidota bacterium]|nr:IPT/TIG domain-containing protein [Bacteroidota bacterium]
YGLEDAFNAYANFLPFVEGEIDLLNSPLWKIWGGFDGNVGIKSEWFKIHKEQTLIEYRYLLKQADDLIISVSPTEARIGDIITIKGSNFGDSRGNSYVGFTIGNSLSNIVKATEYPKWTNGEIQVKIPKGLIAGKVRIFINIGGFPGNMVDFILLETPYPQIVDINPNEGKIGDTITISGLNFGDSQGSSFVSFNGTIAINYTSWSDTQIKVKVPVGATSGKVSVTVNGIKSNDLDLYFTILDDNKVLLINETFEGKLDPRISIITKGVDAIPPGIISTNHFGSSKAFNFGKSTCPVNCFVNNTDVYHQTHYTILRIKFPNPTYISAIKFSTSEMNGNWGSVGQIYIDSKLEKISPDND